jgi:hypothetical protein
MVYGHAFLGLPGFTWVGWGGGLPLINTDNTDLNQGLG